MPREPRWRRYLRFWRRDPGADVDDELRFHFDERVTQFEAAGMARDDALAAARERFGDIDAVRSELVTIDRRVGRRTDAWIWLDALRQDARQVVRSLLRQPGLVATIVVTLALAVGANAAVFSLTDALLFRPPAGVRDVAQLERLYSTHPHTTADLGRVYPFFGYPEYQRLRSALHDVADLGIEASFDSTQIEHGTTSEVGGVSYATAGVLPMLGVHAERGRVFDEQDDDVHTPSFVAVVSHAFAERAYGSADDALGQQLRVRDLTYRIIGVLARGFDGIDVGATAVWIPFSTMPHFDRGSETPWYDRRDAYFPILLRVKPGVDARLVEARATAEYRHTDDASAPYWRDSRILLGPLSGAGGPRPLDKESLVVTRFAGVTVLLLLIACANVANLLVARGIGRRHEVGVRIALGISRRRLATHVLLEALVLSSAAGAASIVVANWTGSILRAQLLPRLSWVHPPVDARVFGFTILITLLAAMLAGALPAAIISRFGIASALRPATHGGAHHGHARALLLIVQSSLCVVLLVGASLFGRSLSKVLAIDLGYDTDRIVLGTAYFRDRLRHPEMKRTIPEIAQAMREMPGVEAASATYGGPRSMISEVRLYRPGDDSAHALRLSGRVGLQFTGVDADYFHVTGTRIIEGRPFSRSDVRGSAPVIVVGAQMAKRVWPDRSAIGQCLKPRSPSGPCYTVVGVAANVHEFQRVETYQELQYYYPVDQLPDTNWSPTSVFVRIGRARTADVVRALDRELQHRISGADIRAESLEQSLEPELRPWKLGARLFAMLSGLALLVSIIGVYGVVAFDVRQRTREIGVRIALGAQQLDVVGLLVKQGAAVVAIGIALGVGGAYYAGRFVASLLYGVTATDPISVGASSALLLLVAIVASAIPAWRANRIDPAVVLRDE